MMRTLLVLFVIGFFIFCIVSYPKDTAEKAGEFIKFSAKTAEKGYEKAKEEIEERQVVEKISEKLKA